MPVQALVGGVLSSFSSCFAAAPADSCAVCRRLPANPRQFHEYHGRVQRRNRSMVDRAAQRCALLFVSDDRWQLGHVRRGYCRLVCVKCALCRGIAVLVYSSNCRCCAVILFVTLCCFLFHALVRQHSTRLSLFSHCRCVQRCNRVEVDCPAPRAAYV